MKPSIKLIAAAVGLMLAGTVTVLYQEKQSLQEQLILAQANASALRQDRQHMQEELDAVQERNFANEEATSAVTPETSCIQTFSGTLRTSSYQDRALEAGVSPSLFPDTTVLLLHLETPKAAIGYAPGDSVATKREITVVRVPVGLDTNGKTANIEVSEPVFWPSDASGLLWDLDLSELQSLN